MIDSRQPKNASELRAALKIGRARILREVFIDNRVHHGRSADTSHFEVSVHPDSKLTVYIYSGLPFLTVTQGTSANVKFVLLSRWGNSVTIPEGQGAQVHVPHADTKATITGSEDDLVLVLPEGEENRVYWPSKYPPFSLKKVQ